MNRIGSLCFAVAAALCARYAQGDVLVFYNGAQVLPGNNQATVTLVSAVLRKYDVTLRAFATDTVGADFVVVSTDGNDRIGLLDANNENTRAMTVIVRGQATPTSPLLSADTVQRSGSGTGFVSLNGLRTQGDVGSISMNKVGGVFISSGSITGSVTAVSCGSCPGFDNDVFLDLVGGDVLGNITAPHGNLRTIKVNGRIGTAATPVVVSAVGRIEIIEAGDINANISVPNDDTMTVSYIDRINIFGTNGYAGHFRGSITAPIIRRELTVAGDFDGDLTLTAPATLYKRVNDATPLTPYDDKIIKVNGSFKAGRKIDLKGALQAQTVSNESGATGTNAPTWESGAQVIIRNLQTNPALWMTLDNRYLFHASEIGGGAAGLAWFFFHGKDSAPNKDKSILASHNFSDEAPSPFTVTTDGTIIWIRHYGPILKNWNPSGPFPVVLERRPIGTSGSGGYSACGAITNVDLDTGASGANANPTRLKITLGYQLRPGSEYRIRPTSLIADVLNTPLMAYSTTGNLNSYKFTIYTSTCSADLNGDGLVNTADLTLLLNGFGASGCARLGDINDDTFINTADLTQLLVQFGSSCAIPDPPPPGDDGDGGQLSVAPRPQTGRLHTSGTGAHDGVGHAPGASGGGDEGGAPSTEVQSGVQNVPGPVLEALGFATPEAYQAWVSTLNEDELWNHLKHVVEVIHALGLD